MSVCVFTRGCARALVCALAMGVADVAAQEAPAKDSEPTPVQAPAEAPAEPAKTEESAPGESKPELKTQAPPNASPLPGMVVDAPKAVTTKRKIKGKTSASAPAITGPEPRPEVPGIVYGQALSDTGTTTFDSRNINMRTDGSGDANTFLRNLPNVQYQNDSSTNGGLDGQSIIDSRPLLLSINGARSYENNFIVNGVSTKNITGTAERTTTPLSDTTVTPSIDSIFGLHPQQLYVPAEFLSQAAVIDSNASAEYGEFLGGVVIYDLSKPPTDRYHATVDFSRHTDSMANFIIATPDGLNRNDRQHPTFEKNNLAVSVGAPITSDLSFILQASQKTAETQKQKDYTLYDGWVTEDSDNRFFRGAVSLRTDIGKFTLDSSLTDYSQYWESYAYRDLAISVDGRTSSTQLHYEGDLPGVRLSEIGLNGVKLDSRAYFNSSDTTNVSPGDTVWNWIGARRTRNQTTGVWTESFRTSELADWCRPVPLTTLPNSGSTANMTCREGGYADMLQGQDDLGLTAKATGDLLFGRFNVGGEIKSVEGHRARLEDYTLYGVSTLVPTAGNPFVCPPGDDGCNSEQYTSSRNIAPAFDAKATVNAIHAFSEIDQTLGWINFRAGMRLDYEDYFKNLNLAPRLAGTVTPLSGFSVTGGYNRYFEGESLYYALRDQQPRAVPAYSRSIIDDPVTGTRTLKPWTTTQSSGVYAYRDDDAETPFTDEYAGAVRILDPLLGGQLRLRYVERYAKKGYSSADCANVTNCIELKNDAESFYRATTAEYTKEWRNIDAGYLNAAAVAGNITWSEQAASATHNNYHDDLEDLDNNGTPDNPILYNNASYTRRDFNFVTGNLDIPIRVGGTLSTNWFNDILLLDFSAGYNFGYVGVYDADTTQPFEDRNGNVVPHDVFLDKQFQATLKLDVTGRINVTEQAAIEFEVLNLTNTAGNSVASYSNPWVLGRTYWVGSALRF